MRELDVQSGGFGPAQQFVEIVRRQVRAPGERSSGGVDEPDGDEIPFRVERALGIKRHRRGERVLGQQDGVAVGRGLGGLRGSERAAGAGDVFDNDRLAQRPLHRVLEDARGGVVGAAGRGSDYQRDRAGGIVLGGGGGDRNKNRDERGKAGTNKVHVGSSVGFALIRVR